jgi:hypothetical protein
MSFKLIDSERMVTKRSSIIYVLWMSELFISLPFFVFFLIMQPGRGPFTLGIVFYAAVICIAAGLGFAAFMWFLFVQPLRKARGFN